jgi:hypothetical protein
MIGARCAPALAVLAGCLVLGSLSQAATATGETDWFQIKLEQGEVNGYHWAVGVKGPKHRPLSQICAELSMVEPPQEGAPYVEERDATDCSSFRQSIHSVFGTESFGSGPSRVTVLEALYRPIVRKVTFVLAGGERRVFLPRVPEIHTGLPGESRSFGPPCPAGTGICNSCGVVVSMGRHELLFASLARLSVHG